MKLMMMHFMLLSSGAHALDFQREEIRMGCRRNIMEMGTRVIHKSVNSTILKHDRAEDLIDEPLKMVQSLKEMDARKLFSAKTKEIPWSDSYWPMYRGGLGQRYADVDFAGYDWQEAKEYVTTHSPTTIASEGRQNILSPSEKYDLLMGLKDFPLTEAAWSDGGAFFRSYGRVESWMGLCHGWAPASMMMPEPKKSVIIESQKGKIEFFVSDIKGYATLLWAKGNFRTKFVGGRCNIQNPASDGHHRSKPQECLDNNPGTWHLVVINQIGVSKRPFIMDASYDYEVWNHPVYAYQYRYYNPKTGQEVSSLQQAMVSSAEWPSDPRRNLRAHKTKFIVGIRMEVTFAIENEPSIEENQASLASQTEYDYDLELNAKGEIIGGEWYTTGHPDFLWVPMKDSFPGTIGEDSQISFSFPLVSAELENVSKLNAVRGVPFGPFVKEIVKRSHSTR